MKVSGIAFQGPMVRAVKRDIDPKTVTRRVVSKQPPAEATGAGVMCAPGKPYHGEWSWLSGDQRDIDSVGVVDAPEFRCPYGVPGDVLYVREAVWMWCERRPNGKTGTGRDKWLYVPMDAVPVHYQVDHPAKPALAVVSPDTGNLWGWRLKIARFMPRRVSRIRLEITDIRIERLQEITEADAKDEGCDPVGVETGQVDANSNPIEIGSYTLGYSELWESINGAGSWDLNEFVWCIYFRRIS